MNEPLFKVGQRVYNRAKPYHGRVIDISEVLGQWAYTLALDPNLSNFQEATYYEADLGLVAAHQINQR